MNDTHKDKAWRPNTVGGNQRHLYKAGTDRGQQMTEDAPDAPWKNRVHRKHLFLKLILSGTEGKEGVSLESSLLKIHFPKGPGFIVFQGKT